MNRCLLYYCYINARNWCDRIDALYYLLKLLCVCVCAWTTFLYSHNKRLTSYDSTRIDINCIIVYRRIVLCQQIDVPNRRIALFIKTTTNLPSIDFLQTCNRYRYTNIFVGMLFCTWKQASNVSWYFSIF